MDSINYRKQPAPYLRRITVGMLAVVLLVVPCGPLAQSQRELPEYEVKAAFLLNFTRYVTWPGEAFADEQVPIVIGVLGTDPFGSVLDGAFRNRTSHGRRLEVRRFRELDEADECHLLFVGHGIDRARALRKVQGLPVLTVGESRQFLDEGGGIRLKLTGDAVRFSVNQAAIEGAGLEVSSRVLSLADDVIRENG